MRKHKFFAIVFMALIFASLGFGKDRQNSSASRNSMPANEEGYPENAPAANVQAPSILTLPAGTLVAVRATQPLSSDRNQPGDSFTAILDQTIIAQGWVVARRGQTVMGHVVTAQKAGRRNASSQLAIELSDLTLVDGQAVPIRTELAEISGGGPSRLRNEGAAVGTTTGVGAVIGAIAGGGPGAAIGAAVGAAAGVAGVLSTRGKATVIEPEALLTFRLEKPVTLSTEQSRQAFFPVSPRDYDREPVRNPDRYPSVRTYPPEPRRYYVPYDYGWYAPPHSYFSFYWGTRPYYYSAPRFHNGRGYRNRW